MPRIETEPRALTVHEVAHRLSVSPRTIWNWIAQGRLKAIRFGPRTTRIPEVAVGEFINAAERRAR